QDLRIHGLRPAHRHHPAPAAHGDRPRRPGRAARARGRRGGPGRSHRAPRRGFRAAAAARRQRARPRGRALFLGLPLRAARARAPPDRGVRVLLATEVYPPRAGGAGWSTRALALGLREAGHDVAVVTTSPGAEDLDGLSIRRLSARGRRRLSVPRVIARALAAETADVVHAQHSLSALGSLAGARPERVAVTVRDHWPVCFWSTRISRGAPCPACGLVPMSRCVDGHVKAPAPLSWGAIPYMMRDLALKRRALARAGATLAVSEAIAAELREAGVPRLQVIPNIVDAREAERLA